MSATLAPASAGPERPTLDVELAARNRCRYRLPGLRCVHAGRVRTIDYTTWQAEPGLWLKLVGSPELVHASAVTLIDRWPLACCPSRLRIDGLPKGSGRRVKAKPPAVLPDLGRDATLADIRAAERARLAELAGGPTLILTNLGSGESCDLRTATEDEIDRVLNPDRMNDGDATRTTAPEAGHPAGPDVATRKREPAGGRQTPGRPINPSPASRSAKPDSGKTHP